MPFNRFFFLKYFLGIHFVADPAGGGGAAPTPEQVAAENAALKAKIAELEKKAKPADDPEDDEEDPEDDLHARAKKKAAKSGDEAANLKRMESSIAFNMATKDFLKANASLLPKDAEEVFAQAEKEKFDSAAEKASEIKSGLVQSFFAVQANVDLLTAGQKSKLDEFLALTKTGKADKAEQVYEMIFEPALERMKAERKAKALNGGGGSSDADAAYREKMAKKSMSHYGMERK